MAQTEVMMLVGLGFVLALLLVFVFGRGIWSMSSRYAKRQRDNDLPAEMLSLQAERDRLRAEHAVMTRQLETINTAAKAKIAGQTAEVSRHRNRVLDLTESFNEKSGELIAKSGEVVNLNAEMQALADNLELQQRAVTELQAGVSEKDAAIKLQEEELERLKLELAESSDKLAATREQLSRTSAGLEAAQAESDALKQEVAEAIAQGIKEAGPSGFESFEVVPPKIVAHDESPVVEAEENSELTNVLPMEQSSKPRPNRYDFDRPAGLRSERNVRPVKPNDISGLIHEARKGMAENVNAEEPGRAPAESIISLAKRLRSIQAKSDKVVSKTLK
jgi:hypothetical protein